MGDVLAAGIINGPTRNGERPSTTRQLFTPPPTTQQLNKKKDSPTDFQVFLRENVRVKTERAAAAKALSNAHTRKTEVEIDLLKQKQKASEFKFKMEQIQTLQDTMNKFPTGSYHEMLGKKLEELIKSL